MRKLTICLTAVACGLVLVALSGILVLSGTALADKPSGDPPKHHHDGEDDPVDVSDQPCVIFDDAPGDNIQSDDGTPYCDNKQAKVEVSFSNDGHLLLRTNKKFFKGDPGRSAFIDFGVGQAITLLRDPEGDPDTEPKITFASTDELDLSILGLPSPLDDQGVTVVAHSVTIFVGANQSNFDMFDMAEGDIRTDVGLGAIFRVDWVDLASGESISSRALIWLTPEVDPGPGEDRHCLVCDTVSVQFLGPNAAGLLEWRVTTGGFDDDGDGLIDEDPINGVDDDGDDRIDEDPPEAALAEVTQNNFVTGTAPRFPRLLQFAFTVTEL